MADDLREVEVGIEVVVREEIDLLRGIGVRIRPTPSESRGSRRRIWWRSCQACSTQRGRPTVRSPPRTTIEGIRAAMPGRVAQTELERMLSSGRDDEDSRGSSRRGS